MNPIISRSWPHLVAIIACLALSMAYFYPQLQGKVIQQGDIIQYRGMSQEIRDFKEKTGENSLWTNAMFGGMPTYQINTISQGNLLKRLENVVQFGIKPPIGTFFIAMIGFYLLLVVLGAGPWLGLAGAIAFGLTTNNLILFEAGHETKLRAISYLPLITAGLLLTFRKKQYLWGGLIFAIGMGMNLMSNHVQMTYYFVLTVLFLGIAELVRAILQGELRHFLISAGVLVLGGLLGLATTASNMLVTYEYSKDTMRGAPILEPQGATPASSSETEGLDWDYAMQWSNGVIDIFASYIPGVAGGSGQEPVSRNSPFGKEFSRLGARLPETFGAPLYWGALPFTSGPIYFGAVSVLLFLMGLYLVRGPVKWWLAMGTALTILLSMGKNMEFFNRFFFDYVPLYNKFRTPNSILSVTAFLVPALGFLTLSNILSGKSSREEVMRSLKVGGGIAAGIALIFLLLGPGLFSFSSPNDQGTIQRMVGQGAPPDMIQGLLTALEDTRRGLMRSDALRTLALVLLSGGLIWAFITGRIKKPALIAGIGVLTLFDLWTVGQRYLNADNFVRPSNYEAIFQARPADQEILNDPDPSFRVFDLTENPFTSTKASYFHQSLGGYHAAKLQRYQDLIDRHLSRNNQKVIDMLNTRYFIIAGQDGQALAQRNPGALGNAWFISRFRMVDTPNQEIDALNDFEPAEEAVVNKEFNDYIAGFTPAKGGNIRLTEYRPNLLTYQSDAPGEQFAVFSEIWYGPRKGWQAYIDGQPVEHIRVNYLLRGMRVPAGQHKIEFVFDPQAFRTGKAISLASSLLLALALLGLAGIQLFRLWQQPPAAPAPERPAAKPKTPSPAPTKSRKKEGKK